jgi:hypothetical protein
MTYEDLFHCLVFIPPCKSHFTIGARIRFRQGVKISVSDGRLPEQHQLSAAGHPPQARGL